MCVSGLSSLTNLDRGVMQLRPDVRGHSRRSSRPEIGINSLSARPHCRMRRRRIRSSQRPPLPTGTISLAESSLDCPRVRPWSGPCDAPTQAVLREVLPHVVERSFEPPNKLATSTETSSSSTSRRCGGLLPGGSAFRHLAQVDQARRRRREEGRDGPSRHPPPHD
jgi:hypothetical protein